MGVGIQNFISDLQELFNQHQDDQAFVDAVKEKWSNEDDLRHAFIVSCQEEGGLRLLDEGGEENWGGRWGGENQVILFRIEKNYIKNSHLNHHVFINIHNTRHNTRHTTITTPV